MNYSGYGWWGKYPDVISPATSASGTYDRSFFVGGSLPTPSFNMPTNISGTYSGGMMGMAVDSTNGALYSLVGSSGLSVDFTANTVIGVLYSISAIDQAGSSMSFNDLPLSGAIGAGSSSFAGTVTAATIPTVNPSPIALATGATTTGTFNGGFYGPLANELAGVFSLNSGTISVKGAYGGVDLSKTIGATTVNGVAAFALTTVNGAAATTVDTATPYQAVGYSMFDAQTPAHSLVTGGAFNNATRVAKAAGNLTGFDLPAKNNVASVNPALESVSLAATLPATVTNVGTDPVSGISWGRWEGGNITSTSRADPTVTNNVALGASSWHWITGPVMTGPVVLPISGTFNYTLAGGTNPTDHLGNVGTLNSASLQADFTAQKVNVGVDATVNAVNYVATANGLPILNAQFGNNMGSGGTLTATANGSAVTAAQLSGVFTGDHTKGTGGAALVYGFLNGATVVNGVAAFHQ